MKNQIWAALVPELTCTKLADSQFFYCNIIGFSVRFERPDEGFVYLELGGTQLMLEQQHTDSWTTGALERPFGRGLNLQIEVDALEPIRDRLCAAGIAVFREPEEAWYREDDIEHGQTEMLIQDPDGYLLRLVEVLGTRAAN